MTGGLVQRVILDAVVFGAERIGGAALHALQSAVEMSSKLGGLAESDEAAERSFAVGSRRVKQNAGHRAVFMFGRQSIDALANAGCGVAAFQRQLAHEGVSQRMEQHVAQRVEAGKGEPRALLRRTQQTDRLPILACPVAEPRPAIFLRFLHPVRREVLERSFDQFSAAQNLKKLNALMS